MLTRLYVKERKTNYVGFGKKKMKFKKKERLQKTKGQFFIIGIKPLRT